MDIHFKSHVIMIKEKNLIQIKYMSQIILEIFARFKNISYIRRVIYKTISLMQNMKSVTIKEFNKVVKSQKLRDIINNLYAKDHDILIYYGLMDESYQTAA